MSYKVIQQEQEFGPLSAEELIWLNQRMLVRDDDNCFSDASPMTPSHVYDLLNRECVAELAKAGIAMTRPFRTHILGTPFLASMTGMQWAELLLERPDLRPIAKLEKLTGKDWVYLLYRNPNFLPYCRWKVLLASHWDSLIKRGLVDASVAQFALASPAEQLEMLVQNPDLDCYVNFDRYNAIDWEKLFLRAPIFIQRHPEWVNSCSISHLRSQYLDKDFPEELLSCLPGDKLTGQDWLALLSARPMLAKYCRWGHVIDAVMKLPNTGGSSCYQRAKDESMTYHHGQQNAWDSYRELWEHRDEIYVYVDDAAIRSQLTFEQFVLLFDFMGWEKYFDVSTLPSEEKLDILAKHPDFGDAWDCWRHLRKSERMTLLSRSPALFSKLNVKAGDIPHALWERLYEATKERDDENALAMVCPLSIADWLMGKHRNNIVLRNRIFMRWLAVVFLIFIVKFLFG